MARSKPLFTLSPVVTAALLAATQAWAQTTTSSASVTQLDAVTVTGRGTPPVTISGWGDTPLAKTPVQASVFGADQLKDMGAQRLADLVGVDPAVSDAYNSEGYYDFLTVRGYVLDNRYNFRRDGLPINAETSIPLDNKAEIEVLKGTSGMQAGTSAPGGLVNYVVKRPTDAPIRAASLEWRQAGSVTAAVDLSQRFGSGGGDDKSIGVRVNAATARIDPLLRNSRGNRQSLAIAADWRVSADTLLEAEVETSHRSQPSQPGFSMLGNTVPKPGDPRLSLNNQPWSLPVVFDATTASLRWQQKLSVDWRFTAHAATQQLRTDDRLAFPFGCTDTDGTYYADRYCPNGTYDLYDYRSENERRRLDAIDLSVQGKLLAAGMAHQLTAGVLQSRVHNRFQGEAYNYVGTGNLEGTLITPDDPALVYPNTNRDERSTEVYARDSVALTQRLTAWLGIRHTRLTQQSVLTDGTEATDTTVSFTTPWVALGYAFARDQLVYASWGRGVESTVVPNQPRYSNGGETFNSESRQTELGLKGAIDSLEWNVAAFDIQRPQSADFGACDTDGSCTTRLDGTAHHRGIEASATWLSGAWTLRGGTQWLRARREGSQTPSVNGLQPTNVPALTLKLQSAYDLAAIPGLNLQAALIREGSRMVLPDNSASIPATTRVDAGLRYDTKAGAARTVWRAGVDNLFGERAWRESPYEFSHAYLYPVAPRSLRISIQVDL